MHLSPALFTPFQDSYPQRLRDRLNGGPYLYVVGDPGLLQRPAVYIHWYIGADEHWRATRRAEEVGVDVTEAAAKRAAQLDWVMIHQVALGTSIARPPWAGGAAVVSVGSFFKSRLKNLSADERQAIHDGQLAICAPFHPQSRLPDGRVWGIPQAMGRTRSAISNAIALSCCSLIRGGQDVGHFLLGDGMGRVGVWQGLGHYPGDAELLERGAEPISSVDELFLDCPANEAASAKSTDGS